MPSKEGKSTNTLRQKMARLVVIIIKSFRHYFFCKHKPPISLI